MEDFHGWESGGALIEGAKIDMTHHDDVRRVAMVGDRAWQNWMTAISAPFASADVRHFDQDELESAREWARNGEAGTVLSGACRSWPCARERGDGRSRH